MLILLTIFFKLIFILPILTFLMRALDAQQYFMATKHFSFYIDKNFFILWRQNIFRRSIVV